MIEYRVYDRRDGREGRMSYQTDDSARSEAAAIRESGVDPVYAECVTRELSPDAAREFVGR